MKAYAGYGAASAAVLVALAMLLMALLGAASAPGVRTAALIAWPVQMVAFVILVEGRKRVSFIAGWAGGMALRFAAVGAAAIWVTRTDGVDPASLLLSLVGFVFVLVLLEPLFLRLTN